MHDQVFVGTSSPSAAPVELPSTSAQVELSEAVSRMSQITEPDSEELTGKFHEIIAFPLASEIQATWKYETRRSFSPFFDQTSVAQTEG